MEENKKEPTWKDRVAEYISVVAVIATMLLVIWIILEQEPTGTTQKQSYCTEFYSSRCPHCMNMVPIVSQVENETGIVFAKLELYNNTINQQTFLKYNDSILRDCGSLGVPAFYSTKTGKAACGEMSKEKLKQFVVENC